MSIRPPRKSPAVDLRTRLSGLLAALLFTVPTLALLCFAVHKSLALWSDELYLGQGLCWLLLGASALLAWVRPVLFTTLLGRIWRALGSFIKWFG